MGFPFLNEIYLLAKNVPAVVIHQIEIFELHKLTTQLYNNTMDFHVYVVLMPLIRSAIFHSSSYFLLLSEGIPEI